VTPALVRVSLAGLDAEVVADALWGHGPASVLEGDGWLEAGFASKEAATRVSAALPWPADVVVVDDWSWQEEWKAHANVIEVGPIVVVPSWRTAIVLDPGTAFGSGSHPSTRLCLGAIVDLVKPGATVLDVGCGSGVLSIAAMKLGAASCVAIDVATEAVQATCDNAASNDVVVDARHALIDDLDGTFDVVVANIGSAVLRSMAPELAARVGEWLVLAGLLDEQVPEVVAAFAPHDLTLDRIEHEDGWAAPMMRRSPD
jgi:ribosomal protein L11 methyltransferase